MNISLTPELEQYVMGKVESGTFNTPSEVIREGLRLLKEREERQQRRLIELRGAIQVGIDQAARAEFSEFNETTLEEVRHLGREKLAVKKNIQK